jgi:transposase
LISQATGRYQLRRCRYIGLAKTLLQHVITAAINLSRMWDWWQDVPRSQTRISHFAQLLPLPHSIPYFLFCDDWFCPL